MDGARAPHELSLSDDELAELRATFLAQTADTLDELDRQALALESGGDPEGLLPEIRRALHTVKGDAAAVGYPRLSALAHRLEDRLDGVELPPGGEAAAALAALLLEWTRLARGLLAGEGSAGEAEAALEAA
ncbi:MAG TPA: Hpt domain-containing protein, partial [Thermodesulfobacteriota bacterium]|nr:Hpt domain-containing protein [Thermodesulfobacteriota bacterium]